MVLLSTGAKTYQEVAGAKGGREQRQRQFQVCA